MNYIYSYHNNHFAEEVLSSVADPYRKNADVDPGKSLNADADADSCPELMRAK
jgi:hypothetical protein